MYIGQRDPEVHILVQQKNCFLYTSKSGSDFVEIYIPPEHIKDYTNPWGSIMVKQNQVDYLTKTSPLNVVRVNDDADIICSVKDEKHRVTSQEVLKPKQIIGRVLKYERYCLFVNTSTDLDIPSIALYQDMKQTGLTMETYLNRLPMCL